MPKNITRPPRNDDPAEHAQWDEDVEAAINKLAVSSHSHGNPTLFLTNITGTTGSNSAGLTLSLSAAAAGAADGVNVLAAGTQTANTTGTIVFSNSNGITFGMSNSSIITAAHNALTTAMASNRGSDFVQATAAFAGTSASGTINSTGISVSIGPYITTGALSNHSHGVSFTSGSVAFQTLSFTNSNGISFNSGTQGIFGSHNALTTAAASDHSHGNPTLALTNLTGTTASASNGFTLSLSAAAPGGGDAIRGIAANGSTASTNTVHFSNSNGVSFGFGAAGNSTVVTASHNAITTGRASTDAVGLNTAQTNVTWTVNSAGISFNAGGYAGTGTSATNASITLDTNGLAISVAAPGGAGAAKSFFQWPEDVGGSATYQVSGSSKLVQPIRIPFDVSVSFLRIPLTMSCVGSQAATASAANQTVGMTVSSTFQLAFYTQGTGANSRSLVFYATTSGSWVQRATIQAGATGSHWSSGHTISYPSEGGNTDLTASGAATSASRTMNSTQLTNFTSNRFLDIPLATSFAAGVYWMAFNSSTSISTSVSGFLSTCRILASNHFRVQAGIVADMMGVATNSSNHFRLGLGSWTTNSIGTTTSSLALSHISVVASHPHVFFQMIRQA